MPDNRDDLTINPIASVLPDQPGHVGHQPAEQGPPPADFATRPASVVPAPAGSHLSAEQVAALVGSDESANDTNIALEETEGVEPA